MSVERFVGDGLEGLRVLTPPDHTKSHGGFSYASTQVNLTGRTGALARLAAGKIAAEDVVRREDSPHVTVKYGIEEDGAAAELRTLFKGYPPALLRFSEVDCFPASETGADEDVVFIRVDAPGLYLLHNAIGLEVDVVHTFPYNPHLTLAYVKAGTGEKYRAMDNPLTGQTFLATVIWFSTREGEMTRIPLRGDNDYSPEEEDAGHKSLKAAIAVRLGELKNCGNGPGGFQPGNTCAKGGDGGDLPEGWEPAGNGAATLTNPYGEYVVSRDKELTFVPTAEGVQESLGKFSDFNSINDAVTSHTDKLMDAEMEQSKRDAAIQRQQRLATLAAKMPTLPQVLQDKADEARQHDTYAKWASTLKKEDKTTVTGGVISAVNTFGASVRQHGFNSLEDFYNVARSRGGKKSWAAGAFDAALKNCGTGDGGFQEGNTCSRGGGDAEERVHPSKVQFSDEEAKVLGAFKKYSYKDINAYLRDGTVKFYSEDEVKDWASKIDSAMEKSSFPKQTTVYRGINNAEMRANPEAFVGATYTDKGFMSVSTDFMQGFDFARTDDAIFFRIKVPEGTPGVYLGRRFASGSSAKDQLTKEKDWVLPRGASLKITKVKIYPDGKPEFHATLAYDKPKD